MKALVFDATGEPRDVLELRDVEEPKPKAGEVLIEVVARPIHPSDLFFVRGKYRLRPEFPQIAGLSGVGNVVDGDPTVGLPRGARVAFRWPGAWAERIAVPAGRAMLLPDGISDDDGAQLPLNPITAWGLLDVAHAKSGDWIGLTAPRSSVAALITALAEIRGMRTVPIQGTADDAIADQVRARTAGEGLAVLLDSVGGSLVERLFSAMQPGGTIVAYGTQSSETITLRNATLIYANLSWYGFGIDRWLAGITDQARAHMLDTLCAAMRDGKLPLPVRGRFKLADFRSALRSAEEVAAGKVLLQ